MANGKAAAQATAWVLQTQERQRAVLLGSAQRAVEEMQRIGPSVTFPSAGEGGHMPIGPTAFLRGSLQIGLNAPKGFLPRPATGAKVSYDPGAAELSIAGATIEDRIFATYGADYAEFVNYRYQFVAFAEARWPAIVADACKEAEARSIK